MFSLSARNQQLKFYGLRLLTIALATTWFVPDETFQSVEVAYRMVYGRGHLTWEWRNENALRSTLHPILYAMPFWILKLLRLDTHFLVNWTPNIIHALLFGAADFSYRRFLVRLFHGDQEAVELSLLLYLSNWFVLYCAPRTLANTLETALTVLALDYYSSIGRAKSNISSQRSGLNSFRLQWILISIAVLIRPTAALIWLPLVLMQFFECSEKSTHLFTAALPCGLISLLTALALDSIYYGRPTLSLWNFIRFNALQGGSAYFGTHPWHWYLTNGLPPLLTVSTPFLLTHLFLVTRQVHRRRISKRYLWTAIAYIALHSLITHKEHRFVLPTLPLLMPYLGVEVLERIPRLWGAWRSRFKLFVISVNMTLALYFGLIHQRGSTQVMHSLIQQISSKTVSTDMSEHASSTIHILQLMPCFSMPQYAALHLYGTQVKIRMLECTSSVEKHFTDKAKITNKYGVEKRKEIDSNSITDDEADRFHNNPLDWLHERSSDSDSMRIDIVVAFEKTYRRVQTFFEQRNFTVVKRIFHTHFPLSDRQDRWIVVAIKSE